MKGKALLSISDLSGNDILALISDTVATKARGWRSVLDKKVLALIFEKPSLRTRVSFEVAMRQLGGQAIYLSPAEVGLGERESVADVARVLSRYVDAIVARTFSHQTLEILASYSAVPVLNALSDLEHPCQALADLVTIYEKKGELGGLTLAFVGDGNNVAHSLLLAAALTGMNFRIASPAGYAVQPDILDRAEEYAAASGAEIFCTEEPPLAVSGADIVYTDVWTSMGQEAEAAERRRVFANYQVNGELLSLAKEDAILMHPLPAHRGEEVGEDILDSLQSVVFDQAENRLHLQKALLVQMLGGLGTPLAGYR
ncbi:MAG: ornithine carbamoyltransferase [Chloroflexi bacterium]|nr:ornithine carbamoyltransferase [Chloroflexota bacterium]MBI3040581.1 ornithine carbamoyltransferase [Chloroflexota bacterium]